MDNASGYVSNIVIGLASFPFVALLITVPYMVVQYRRFGSIPWLRTLIVYSFVFYLMVAFFMVIMPLPEDHTAFVPYAAHPQLVPFTFARGILASATLSPADPASWLSLVRNQDFYEAAFNVLLLMPLGMYLRYYFRRTWWQTLLIGFGVTLFFELSQLTGLWGLYEHPYRLFDVDDLMLNTLGALVGYWLAGPLTRRLPDIRVVNEEAREAGLRAGALRRALSFAIDAAVAGGVAGVLDGVVGVIAAGGAAEAGAMPWGGAEPWTGLASFLALFVAVPSATHGRTLGQRLLRLRIVRPDARDARWYQYLARYGMLYLFIALPVVTLEGIVSLGTVDASELGAITLFLQQHQVELVWAWLVVVAAWALSLVARAAHAAVTRSPFIMLNGLLSMTRVMSEEGVERERERRTVLDVDQVAALERAIADDGTSLSDLMARAGAAVAEVVRSRVPDPAPVVVLAGTGNNGGDGWVAAQVLAEAGYPVTLMTTDLAERLHAEPARTTAIDVFAEAARRDLPLRVIVRPEADVLAGALERSSAVIDALLGTGFSGDEVRDPLARWIAAANRRRFSDARSPRRGGQGRLRGGRRKLPERARNAPFAVAVDVPSGLSAQTGKAAHPCFAADVTVTMLTYKPGLVAPEAQPLTGSVRLAKLVETRPFLERLTAERSKAVD